jgi:O-antigen/teichoic acid export membrane protein
MCKRNLWPTAIARLGQAEGSGARRQAATLAGAQLASSALGALAFALVAREISSRELDVFALCVASILPSFELLFDPGITLVAARTLALAADAGAARRAIGALTVGGLAAGCLFALAVAAAVPLARSVYQEELGPPLLAAAPLTLAIPLQRILEQACLGANRVALLATSKVLAPISNLVTLLAFAAHGGLTPTTTALALLGGNWVSLALLLSVLRPSFAGLAGETRRIAAAIRAFGLQVYAGRLMAFASGRLDMLLVPYLAGTTDMGLYSCTQKLFQPLSSIARSAAATRFKSLALARSVGRAVRFWNTGLMLAATAGAILCGPVALGVLLGFDARRTASFVLPCAVSALFGGLVQPYNVFLSAHGSGVELRRIAFATCLTSLIGLVVAVPTFGLLGAAWWSAFSAFVHFGLHLRWYGRVVGRLRVSTSVVSCRLPAVSSETPRIEVGSNQQAATNV